MSDYKSYWFVDAGGLQIHPNRVLRICTIKKVIDNQDNTLQCSDGFAIRPRVTYAC